MSCIYLIQSGSGGPVKIGLTTGDPAKRVAQLQTGNPMPLSLVGCIPGDRRIEQHLHRGFAAHNLQGEWFSPAPLIFEVFVAGREWPAKPQTIPPVTERGLAFMQQVLSGCDVAERYPDGTKHSETDWDDLAVLLDEWESVQ